MLGFAGSVRKEVVMIDGGDPLHVSCPTQTPSPDCGGETTGATAGGT